MRGLNINIPPPPDGSGIKQNASIPPPPDGSGVRENSSFDRFEGLDFSKPLSLSEKAGKAWSSAWGSLAESTGAGLEWIGHENDIQSISNVGKDLQQWGVTKQIENYQDVSKDIQNFDVADMAKPDWWAQKATTIIPSVLSLMAPSVLAYGAGSALGAAAGQAAVAPFLPEAALAGGAPAVALEAAGVVGGALGGALAASGVSRTLEGIMEAGGTWKTAIEELKKQGHSDEDAKAIAAGAASEVFRKNYRLTGVDAVQFALAFAPISKLGQIGAAVSKVPKSARVAGVLATEAGTEAGEEGYQNWIASQAINRVKGLPQESFDEFMAKPENQEAMALGGIGGLAFGSLGQVGSALQSKSQKKDEDLLRKSNDINEFSDKLSEAQTPEDAIAVQQEFRKKFIIDQVVTGQSEYIDKRLDESVKGGLMSAEEASTYKQTVKSFDKYMQDIGDVPLSDDQKREAFDLTWQDENLRRKISEVEADQSTAPAIKEAKIKVLKGESNTLVGRIGELFNGAPSKVEEEKEQAIKQAAENGQANPLADSAQEEIIAPSVQNEEKTGQESSQPLQVQSEVTNAPAKEVGEHEAFKTFIDTQIVGKRFNAKDVTDKQRAFVLARHLEEKPERKISGTLELNKEFINEEGDAGHNTKKHGVTYYVNIGGQRLKTSSREYLKGYKEKNLVDMPVTVKLIKPTDEDFSDLQGEKFSVIETDNGKRFKFEGTDRTYPYVMRVLNSNTGRPMGNIRTSNAGDFKAEKALKAKPSVSNPKFVIKMKDSVYSFNKNNYNDVIVKDSAGVEMKGKLRNTLMRKYEENFDYNSGERIKQEDIPAISSPDELFDYIANTSKSPVEVAETYDQARKEVFTGGNFKESQIADAIGKSKISRNSYYRFGDKNKAEEVQSFLSDKGLEIDTDIAMNTSDGSEISSQDIVDFMEKYGSMRNYRKSLEGVEPGYMNDLRGRFKVLTGFDLTDKNLQTALGQASKDESAKFGDYLKKQPVAERQDDELTPDYDAQLEYAQSLEDDDVIMDDEDLAQRQKAGVSEVAPESLKEFTDKVELLKKALPGVEVVMDADISGAGELSSDGKTIKINSNYYTADTAIHEFGHALIDILGGANNKFISKGIEQLRDTPLWNKVAKNYPELSEEMLEKEVLATAIGREGVNVFNNSKSQGKFKNWLDSFFDRIKRFLGIERNVAKNLASQLLAGREISSQTVATGETQQQKKVKVDSFNSWGKKNGFDLNGTQDKINELEKELEGVEGEEADKIQEEIDNLQNSIEVYREEYETYLADRAEVEKLINSKGDISELSYEELLDLQNKLRSYDGVMKSKFGKEVLFNIGERLNEEQLKTIKSVDPDFDPEKDTVGDLKKSDVWFQGLSTISQRFPAIQKVFKIYRDAFGKQASEFNKVKEEGEKLANAVIKEYHKTHGIKERAKNFVFGGGHKYYSYMAKDGEFIQKGSPEYNKLSTAQKNLLDFILAKKDEYAPNAFADGTEYSTQSLLKSDAGFTETLGRDGLFKAYSNFLTKSYNLKQTKVEFTDPVTNKKSHEHLGDVENILNDYVKKGQINQAKATLLITKYNLQAKKNLSNKKNSDGTPIDPKGNNSRFWLSKEGKLVGKNTNVGNEEYSENFYNAFMGYAKDAIFSKHMTPVLPAIDGVRAFYKSMGDEKENVVKFLDTVKKGKFLGDTIETGAGSGLDSVLKALRKWTSWRYIAFNIPANLFNVMIGEYNQFRADGGKAYLKGKGRLLSSAKNKKAFNVLKKFTPDIFSNERTNPENYIGKYFDMLAFGGLKMGESLIRGSGVMGKLSDEHYSWLDDEGNVIGKNAAEKQYREQVIRNAIAKHEADVDKVQGRYSEVNRRNFAYYELGQFFGQFKTWMPEWFSERFGGKYIDADGKVNQGSFSKAYDAGLKDLIRDMTKKDFYTSQDPKWIDKRKNLRGAIITASLLMLSMAESDDDKDKEMSKILAKALRDMNFIYRTDNLSFLAGAPAASMSVVQDFTKALNSAVTLQRYKSEGKYGNKGDLRAPGQFFNLAPGNRVLDLPMEVLNNE